MVDKYSYIGKKVGKIVITDTYKHPTRSGLHYRGLCECGTYCVVRVYEIKQNIKKACSKSCAFKGHKHSEETKLKMSAAKIGRYVGDKSPSWKGGLPNCTGCGKVIKRESKLCSSCATKELWKSPEYVTNTIKAMKEAAHVNKERLIKNLKWSMTLDERKAISGPNSPLWKGNEVERDTHKGFEYREWRKAVHRKCNYTCKKCGQFKGELQAHHIKAYRYKATRYDVDNGVTLCKSCHKTFHSKYGTIKFSPLDFKEFLKEYI